MQKAMFLFCRTPLSLIAERQKKWMKDWKAKKKGKKFLSHQVCLAGFASIVVQKRSCMEQAMQDEEERPEKRRRRGEGKNEVDRQTQPESGEAADDQR